MSGQLVIIAMFFRDKTLPFEDFSFTEYFETRILAKRPYLKREWCVFVIENPVRSERQDHNRYRFWAPIPELDNRYLRVITLADQTTIHNAFPDRGFRL